MKNKKIDAAKRVLSWVSLASKEEMRAFFAAEVGLELCTYINEYVKANGGSSETGLIFLGYLIRVAESRPTFMAAA